MCIEDGRLEAGTGLQRSTLIHQFILNIVSSLNLDGLKGGLVAREIGANIKNIAFPVNLH